MILTPIAPIAGMHGKLLGHESKWHVRTNRRGTVFTARNGNPQTSPTEKQLAQQEKMRNAVARCAEIFANEKELACWKKDFAEQKQYVSMRGFIISRLMKADN